MGHAEIDGEHIFGVVRSYARDVHNHVAIEVNDKLAIQDRYTGTGDVRAADSISECVNAGPLSPGRERGADDATRATRGPPAWDAGGGAPGLARSRPEPF